MAFSLDWLPRVLRGAGLKVAEEPGWADRGRGEMGTVLGVMCHHTATRNPQRLNMPPLRMLREGRSDLPGPLAQLGLGLDGTFYVVAAGRANHAGPGEWRGVTGNSRFIGIEGENSGLAEDQPWPEVQMDAYRRGVAAILTRIGATADMCCGHKEYAPGRKPDPLFDMRAFREDVGAIMRGSVPVRPLIAATSASGRPTLRRGSRGPAVTTLQQAVGATPADGIFGPTTEAMLRQFQRSHRLVPDGIAGPATWAVIDQSGPVEGSAPPSPPAPTDGLAPPPPAPSPAALPPVDSPDQPVRMDGIHALTPDGRRFARRHKLGFFQIGSTTVRAFVDANPSAVQGISPAAIRIVSAVTENEGRFEAINSWDSAFLSVGILQWTAGQKSAEGEIAALLARVRDSDPAAFQECYGRFGIGVDITAGRNTGFLTLDGQRLANPAQKNKLRSAEWAYRFWRAAHHPAVRRAQLQLAVDRIASFSDRALHGHRLCDWLSSELGMAMILDQHVNRPGHVPDTLNAALAELLGTGSLARDPSGWSADDEDRLLDRYVDHRANTSMTDQLQRANRLIALAERGSLSTQRGSFA